MKKVMAVVLIITGILLISYPKLKETYYNIQQEKMMQLWEDALTELTEYEDTAYNENTIEEELSKKTAEEERKIKEEYISKHMEGLLYIEKINLKMPIITGITKKNLAISAASIEGTGSPGEPGNYCIAAHRGRTFGRQFNRLDELVKGDIIEVLSKETKYKYEVTEKLLVKAEDTWVLMPDGKEKLITLITCDYSTEPWQRLIIKGRLIKDN